MAKKPKYNPYSKSPKKQLVGKDFVASLSTEERRKVLDGEHDLYEYDLPQKKKDEVLKEQRKAMEIAHVWMSLKSNADDDLAKSLIDGIAKENNIDAEELTNTIKMIIANPLDIQKIKNPIYELQLMVIMDDHDDVFKYIDNPTEIIQFQAICMNKDNMKHIKNPSLRVRQLYAEKYGKDDKDKERIVAEGLPDDIKKWVLESEGVTVAMTSAVNLDNETEDAICTSVANDEHLILNCVPEGSITANWFKENDIKFEDGWEVNDIVKANPDKKSLLSFRSTRICINRVCLMLVMRHVTNHKKDDVLVRFVQAKFKDSLEKNNMSVDDFIDMANKIKKDVSNLKDINNPPEEVQLMAVMDDASAIKYIDNPSERVQFETIRHDYNYLNFIDNPTEHIKRIHKQLVATHAKHRNSQTIH